jgi:hypothetical protein
VSTGSAALWEYSGFCGEDRQRKKIWRIPREKGQASDVDQREESITSQDTLTATNMDLQKMLPCSDPKKYPTTTRTTP